MRAEEILGPKACWLGRLQLPLAAGESDGPLDRIQLGGPYNTDVASLIQASSTRKHHGPPENPRQLPAGQRYLVGVLKARLALERAWSDRLSIWDSATLERNSALSRRLDDYLEGQAGNSVRELTDLEQHTPAELDALLQERGFHKLIRPLRDFTRGAPVCVRMDGSQTPDCSEPGLVPQEIYVHPDGGMVRVKPYGAPGNLQRPEPHVSRSVLLTPSSGSDFRPEDGLELANEAFKLAKNGFPVPVLPAARFGYRAPSEVPPEERPGYTDYLMCETHRDF